MIIAEPDMVLPLPVGAEISTFLRSPISLNAYRWGGVSSLKLVVNHRF